jgi:hypothetical protein
MLTKEEGVAVTRHERIFVAPAPPLEALDIHRAAEELLRAAEREDRAGMLVWLQRLLPAYTPSPLLRGAGPAESLLHDEPATEPVGVHELHAAPRAA